jgi:endogenous inhibitor of DNA gyrase (YacG/DUF329 family)
MDKHQKEKILALRGSGETFAKIAGSLGLSVNTVKSFCRRNGINAKPEDKSQAATETILGDCPQCGNKVAQTAGRKPRRFCSDKCRVLWWNSHSGDVRQKALYSFVCAFCGKGFTAYGNAKRRYCSHSCYCSDRFSRNHDGGKAAAV